MLKLTVPMADAVFRAGYVAAWHKSEGEPIGFGDDICDIAIDEFVALQRTKRATLLGSSSRWRRRRIRDGIDHREGRGVVHIRLTSSETGLSMKRIFVPEGGRIEIGSVIAALEPRSADAADSEIDVAALTDAPEARVVVNQPDAGEIDPFDT